MTRIPREAITEALCPVCDVDDEPGGGLLFDPTACGDPEHCDPHMPCTMGVEQSEPVHAFHPSGEWVSEEWIAAQNGRPE